MDTITRTTKTGIILTLIQGGGESKLGPVGKLRLVSQDDTAESLSQDATRELYSKVKFLWDCIAGKLTLSQYEKTMGVSHYEKKARVARQVSKNKTVLKWADEIVDLCQQASRIESAS